MHMTDTPLDDPDLARFVADQFLVIPDCLPAAQAKRWTDDALRRCGFDPADRSTWPEGHRFLATPADAPAPCPVAELRDLAPKAWAAACQLLGGAERIEDPVTVTGDLVMNFPMRPGTPSTPPSGWHVDGDFNHFIDSPECGLLAIVLFSDVLPDGGPTWIAPDSIGPICADVLAHPQGLSAWTMRAERGYHRQCRRFVPLVGAAGSVVLMHPLMLHSSSLNTRDCARAIRNLFVPLREPMRFDPAARPLSPVERATLSALGVERLDFTPPPAHRRHATDHETGAAQPRPYDTAEQRRTSITVDAATCARQRCEAQAALAC
ncbi:MAG: phytanoyl-CoA dioxygenase family protein [Planctomycetes bacterium]|nr:phytanoyl-CoA dioxygenase family protein [Planctomycetota bacterium]